MRPVSTSEKIPTGDVAVFQYTPRLKKLIAYNTNISGKFLGMFFATSKALLRNIPTGDVAVFEHTPKLTVLALYETGVSGKFLRNLLATSLHF